MKFGNRLKTLRLSKDMTQEELGCLLGKTKNSISQYETGKREPDLETLMIISEYFNVTLDYLLGKTENPHHGDSDYEFGIMVGLKIKTLMNLKGISEKDFEDKFMRYQSTEFGYFDFSHVESGEYSFGISIIKDIAKFFDSSVDYLIGITDDPAPKDSANHDQASTDILIITRPITLDDWPEFLARLPECDAMLFQNQDYPDDQKIVIMEEAEKAKQKKLKKIEKFMQYPVEVIDDALIYAAFDADQRKKMNDEN